MSDTPTEALIHLVQETVRQLQRQGRTGEADMLETFHGERLIPLLQREMNAKACPYILSLVGLTNVGKSTLAEALLGFPVAPARMGVATAIPVEYS